MGSKATGQYYDLNLIKQIPIAEICNTFGIEIQEKGGKLWCKVRPERTASTLLHPDKNTYHDFGTNESGDSIGIVSAYCGVDRGEAIHMIGKAFDVTPMTPREGLNKEELSSWEYAKIGLVGRMASMNFDFDLSRQSFERVSELSLRYAMPMNALKVNHPRIYERLLKQRAIPYVRDLRNEYYSDVFSQYQLAKAVGNVDVFHSSVEKGAFSDKIRELQASERILERACAGTRLKAYPPKEYEPASDIGKLLSGEIKLELGSISYGEMKKLSQEHASPVKYRTVCFDGFLRTGVGDHPHTAFVKAGNVIVGYLEKDWKDVKPYLDKMGGAPNRTLDQKISQAQQCQAGQQLSDSIKAKNDHYEGR